MFGVFPYLGKLVLEYYYHTLCFRDSFNLANRLMLYWLYKSVQQIDVVSIYNFNFKLNINRRPRLVSIKFVFLIPVLENNENIHLAHRVVECRARGSWVRSYCLVFSSFIALSEHHCNGVSSAYTVDPYWNNHPLNVRGRFWT